MKRSTAALVGIVCLAIGAVAGYYAGAVKESAVKEPMLTSTGIEDCRSDMKYYTIDELQKSVVPSAGETDTGETATAVCIAWLLESAITLAEKQAYMHFVVEAQNENGDWKVLDPKLYHLYAEGYDAAGNFGAMEQFPPKIWP